MIKALNLSHFVLQNSEKRLSNLELQKYLYLCETFFIREFSLNLINEDFSAWRLGPVITDVYWEYRNYGANSIDIPSEKVNLDLKENYIKNILDSVAFCDKFNYWELVRMICVKGGAWDINYKEGEKNIINKKHLINLGIKSEKIV